MQDNGDEWMSQKRNVGGLCERQIRYARKTYGIILSEESLETLLVEVEAIVDSRLLTTDLLTDLNILIPLSPHPTESNQLANNETKSDDVTFTSIFNT